MRQSTISKNSPSDNFPSLANYFGIAISFSDSKTVTEYADIERFFLQCTMNFNNSRTAEGILCWIDEYGHLISPSKIRKLIKDGIPYDKTVLGGILEFMKMRAVGGRPLSILKKYVSKRAISINLFEGPRIRNPAPYFKKVGLLTPNFLLDQEKFLHPRDHVLRSSLELRNRCLFGSVLNSDVASALFKNPQLSAYAVSRLTGHHKANVFKNFLDIKSGLRACRVGKTRHE